MKPERWQQIDQVLESALEREPGERAAFLDQACAGDYSLRREVESLIASHEQAGSFIETPAFEVAARIAAVEGESLAAGQRINHYQVLAKLGAGGMGEVYLAQDTRLGRQIALKLLPPYLIRDESRLRRFQQEARTASALNHPNILTVYEIGEVAGRPFIATEYIEGETLRRQMTGGRIRLSEVLDAATQVAAALTAAHQAGIVHRDIKPENIMVRCDGYVKVLDFGLAKPGERKIADSEATTMMYTDPNVVMGTVSYMSPEQVRGLKVDARSDIWSLGVVLYEMLAGRMPFEGATTSDVIVAILEREPPALRPDKGEVPAELQRIVKKALRKEREERYQNVKDMSLDLKNLRRELEIEAELGHSVQPTMSRGETTTVQPRVEATGEQTVHTNETGALQPRPSAGYPVGEIKGRRRGILLLALAALAIAAAAVAYDFRFARTEKAIDSLAVLPLANVSSDPNAEYLSDGITESVINSLSQLPTLRVIARSTAFRYKGREVDPQTVGRELGVRAVLMGRVNQRGDTLSIQADLVDVASGSQLWGEQYNRQLSDIFAVQQDISREISEKLRLRLSGEEQKQLTKHYTEDAEAYQLYLKGRYFWNKRSAEGLRKSITYFQQAIDLDPNYALAYAGLADSYALLSNYNVLPPEDAYPRAKAAAMKALEIDNTLAEAYTSLAVVKVLYDWDWPGAEREFKRAIELNPHYANGHYYYSYDYLSPTGRHQEAIAEMKRAQELDPLSPVINTNLGRTYHFARQYDRAIEQYRKALEIDPNFELTHFRLGEAYGMKGMYEEAIAELKKTRDLSAGKVDDIDASLGYVYAVSGKRDEARKLANELKGRSKQSYSPYLIAMIYTGLGDKEQALAWLQKAYEERTGWLLLLGIDPRWDNLRTDSRFTDLVRRVGLTP